MIKRIESKEEAERKRKLRVSILSIILLLILVLSTLGYAFFITPNDSTNNNQTPPIENNQNNQNKIGRITFNYQGQQLSLLSTYQEIENIDVNITLTPANYAGKTLYISADNEGILRELANLGSFSARAQEACYGKCEKNLPEKNCTDNIIVWNQSLNKKVYQRDSCIFIEGNMAAVDAFLYRLFNP